MQGKTRRIHEADEKKEARLLDFAKEFYPETSEITQTALAEQLAITARRYMREEEKADTAEERLIAVQRKTALKILGALFSETQMVQLTEEYETGLATGRITGALHKLDLIQRYRFAELLVQGSLKLPRLPAVEAA